MKGLGRQLKRLEQTDPKVGAAAKKYAELVDAMIDHDTVTIETTTAPDALGRQRFSIVWWDESFHMGPQWRGQHFHDRIEPHIARAKAYGKRVVVRAKQ